MNSFAVSSLPFGILHWPRPSWSLPAEMQGRTEEQRASLEQEGEPSGGDTGAVNSH